MYKNIAQEHFNLRSIFDCTIVSICEREIANFYNGLFGFLGNFYLRKISGRYGEFCAVLHRPVAMFFSLQKPPGELPGVFSLPYFQEPFPSQNPPGHNHFFILFSSSIFLLVILLWLFTNLEFMIPWKKVTYLSLINPSHSFPPVGWAYTNELQLFIRLHNVTCTHSKNMPASALGSYQEQRNIYKTINTRTYL